MPSSLLTALATSGRSLAEGLLHLLYPNLCWICAAAVLEPRRSFCPACQSALTLNPLPACPRCAATVGPFALTQDGCPLCKHEAFAFERVIRLGKYDGLLREVVLRLKHQKGESLAEVVGRLWVEQTLADLRALGAEVVIPVPLHWQRRWSRGYNQSEVLAAAVASGLNLPMRPRWLRRVRATPFQTAQTSPTARRSNLHDAFRVSAFAKVRGKVVLLVDDVLTTGSTANEAARALKRAGARVVVVVLARADG